MSDASITITGNQIFGMNLDATIRAKLHENTPELSDLLVFLVSEKTPVRSGALLGSITGIPYTDDGDDLAYVYADPGPQLDQYNRVYAPYQEGPSLGLSTFTNAPHQMFARTGTDDLPLIAEWAREHAQEALDLCVAGGGIPA